MSDTIEHTPKLWELKCGAYSIWMFYCPGCKHSHPYHVGDLSVHWPGRKGWTFNGDVNKPTFTPSLMCNQGRPSQCHLYLTDGKIHYLGDCHHDLKGKVVEMEEI